MVVAARAPASRRALRRAGTGVLAVAVVVIAGGNLAIVGASLWVRRRRGAGPSLAGVPKLGVVDERLWRGAAPSPDGYRALAAAGVRTVVDLRAERHVRVDDALLRDLGIRRIALPVRDGQVPTGWDVEQLLAAVAEADGPVFVHCGAGVGRTGSMVAAYRAATQRTGGLEAVAAALAVGPPSLEQLAFVGGLARNRVVVAASRVLDAPRRLWSVVRTRTCSTLGAWT